MKCQECEKVLEEYLDGELDARESGVVETHLAACELCAHAYDSLLSEQTLYAAYEREVEATAPRLWGGVEARIRAGETGREVGLLQRVSAWFAPLLTAPRFSPALTAALVLVAIGLTVGVMRFTGSRSQPSNDIARNDQRTIQQGAHPAPTTAQPSATAPPVAVEPPNATPTASPEQKQSQPENLKTPKIERKRANDLLNGGASAQQATLIKNEPKRDQTPEQLVREAEQRYIAAINMLKRDVASRRSHLDPQTTARFDETLAAIDRSIAETRRTVAQHSNDPVAVQYMLSAYAKKVEVMREMAHLEQGN
jgi:hypothetical protein